MHIAKVLSQMAESKLVTTGPFLSRARTGRRLFALGGSLLLAYLTATAQAEISPPKTQTSCAAILASASKYDKSGPSALLKPTIDRAHEARLLSRMKRALKSGEAFPRLLTKSRVDTPDPSTPSRATLPDGRKKWIIGLSGQQVLMLDSLEELESKSRHHAQSVKLLNKNGFSYGREMDPNTGEVVDYTAGSATWDLFVEVIDIAGRQQILIYAGGMADDDEGKPLMSSHNNTRQRLVFDGEFEPDGFGNYTLVGHNPRPLHYPQVPKNGDWANAEFRHGYGGEVVRMKNGDLYRAPNGRPQLLKEEVVEQSTTIDLATGKLIRIPYRTAIVMADLDETLTRVIGPSRIVLDVFKSDGSVFEAAQRPGEGPLVEGGHLNFLFNDKVIESMAELQFLRESGRNIQLELDYSSGQYFGRYGAYMAFGLEKHLLDPSFRFNPMVDERGEMIDIMKPLRTLFTWGGRPMRYHLGEKTKMLAHGVPRASITKPGVMFDVAPGENFPLFKRQILDFEIQHYYQNGRKYYRIKDTSGLLDELNKYSPRRFSSLQLYTATPA